ncbi:DUF7289 family protein [Halovivax cerinus]|uniref:DUF7305 domain-containing protein n=1 Tax=Halovivax cerinus TaxID=1487865 RepID=A0ABD5NPR7_9EURY|nr:hypothetical protein [Halovivax cerinus]
MTVGNPAPGGDGTPRRAQVEVIGVVLLVGLVAIGALGLMLVASGAVSDTQSQAEQERVQQSFVQLGQTMTTETTDRETPSSMSFDAGDSGAITKTNAGNITIKGGDVNVTRSVGAIEYRHTDGGIIAYQAGAVFAERGNQTEVLSRPPITYDADGESLRFPITNLREQKDLSSGPISIRTNSTDPMQRANLVRNDTVTVTIESPYYRGWETYFEEEAGSGVVDAVHHSNQTVVVKFGYFDIDEAVQNGATIGGKDPKYLHDQHGNIGNEYRMGMLLPEMDPVITELVQDAKTDPSTKDPATHSTLTAGRYYVDEIDGNVEEDVDLSTGNVTLVIGGDVKLDAGSIHVTNRDAAEKNVLRIYAAGDEFALDGDICIESGGGCAGDATAIQFYGPSTMGVDLGPGSGGTFEGILYVASNEEKKWWNNAGGRCDDHHQVREQANGADFTGSMIAYSVCAHSNGNDFDYDQNLTNRDLDPYPDGYSLPPQLTYLNVAVHEMDVDND